MTISIGCDHIVTEIKDHIAEYLKAKGYKVIDNGTYDKVRTHYPIYGKKAAEKVVSGEADFGIVLCGTGVGVTNGACKVRGARVVLARDIETAREARKQLNANILGFGGRITGIGLIENIIDVFLATPYEPTTERDKLIARLDDMVPPDDPATRDHFFDEFLAKWDRGEYHD